MVQYGTLQVINIFNCFIRQIDMNAYLIKYEHVIMICKDYVNYYYIRFPCVYLITWHGNFIHVFIAIKIYKICIYHKLITYH